MSSEVHTSDYADKEATFRGYAAYAAKEEVKPFQYNPPKLRDDWCEIEIACCGICGSDIHTIDSDWGPSNYPVIVGHEIVGKVVAVGPDVKHIKVGDRVGVGAQCGACLNRENNCEECAAKHENHCRNDLIWTYNSPYEDGQISQGGYADRVRCASQFAFKIPESISSQEAAPLMCAGVTTFAPLKRYMTKKGMKVAVIGVGGLGHLAIKFAAKLAEQLGGDADVTAISHSSKKKDDALKMGARHFIDTSDKKAIRAAFRKFDFILSTANGTHMDIGEWLSMIRLHGTFCTVGLPSEAMNIHAFSLVGAEINVTASGIGSIADIEEMLQFADKYNVRPIIERMPMEKANEGLKKVRDGSVRYRVVLENPTK